MHKSKSRVLWLKEGDCRMKIVCAWCGREMGEKPLLEDKSVAHSIRPDCKEKHFGKKRKKLESSLLRNRIVSVGLWQSQ